MSNKPAGAGSQYALWDAINQPVRDFATEQLAAAQRDTSLMDDAARCARAHQRSVQIIDLCQYLEAQRPALLRSGYSPETIDARIDALKVACSGLAYCDDGPSDGARQRWEERFAGMQTALLALRRPALDAGRAGIDCPSTPAPAEQPKAWAGPDWDDLEPLVRRLLRYMQDRDQASVEELQRHVWEDANKDIDGSPLSTAMSKANKFLGKRQHPLSLEKVRGEPIVRWV